MSGLAIGAIIAGSNSPLAAFKRSRPARSGAVHRTGAPVLRDSVEAGTFEDSFYAVPARGETDKILRAARNALDTGRRLRRAARLDGRQLTRIERALAALTAGAVRVFQELCTLARLNRGKLFPSYDHLADATGLGRGTVARALTLLENAGFVARQRRFKRIEAEGPGPRYKQTSNVYRLDLPKAVLAYLPRWMRPPPLPVDEVQREAERQGDVQQMLATLNCRDLARATVTSGPLAKVLAKLGAHIDAKEREFDNGPQSLLDSSVHG